VYGLAPVRTTVGSRRWADAELGFRGAAVVAPADRGGCSDAPPAGGRLSGRAATEHGPSGPRAVSWFGPDSPVSNDAAGCAATGGALIP
jgi:hypothetical protein